MNSVERAEKRFWYGLFSLYLLLAPYSIPKSLVYLMLLSQCQASYLLRDGFLKFSQDDEEGATADFYRSLWLDPNEPETNTYLPIARFFKHVRHEKIEDYNLAIQLNPKDSSAYNNRGTARFEKGDKELAIEDYTRAIEINSSDAYIYWNRATAYLELGNLAIAREDFQKAAQLFLERDEQDLYRDAISQVESL